MNGLISRLRTSLDWVKAHRLFSFACLGIVFLALFLRLNGLPDGIIFGYDQARDAFRTRSILTERNLILVGPETDIPGVHHGILYYYFLAIPYAITTSPVLATVIQASIHAVASLLVILVSATLFGGMIVPLLAGLLFAVSYELVQYAKWLSNPSFSIISLLLFYWGIYQTISGKKWGIILSFIALAVSIHFQLFLAYLTGLLLLTLILYRSKKHIKPTIIGLVGFILLLLPFALAELKFDFQTIRSFLNFFQTHSSYNSPIVLISKMFEKLNVVSTNVFLPTIHKSGIWLVLGSAVLVLLSKDISKKTKTFLFLIFGYSFTVFFFSSGALETEFGFIAGVLPLFFLFLAAIKASLRHKYLRIVSLIIVAGCVIGSFQVSYDTGKRGAALFSVQQAMTYGLERQLIDYIYQDAKGEPFSVCTLTNPLHINTTWAYLFQEHGKTTYGYLPFYAGPGQPGRLGDGILTPDTTKPPQRYLIYEPQIGFTDGIKRSFTEIENGISSIVETKHFGDFSVEKRILLSPEERDLHFAKRQEMLSGAIGGLFSCFN